MIDVIAESEDQDSATQLVLLRHKRNTNPFKTLQNIDIAASRIKWIYKHLIDADQTDGMNLEQIQEVLEFVREWNKSKIESSIATFKVKGLIAGMSAMIASANILKDEQKQKLDQLADHEAAKCPKVKAIFDQLCEVSKMWE
jgi:hypothetical protein